MKRYIITAVATVLLSSCGIYNRYTSVTDVPEDLYGNQVEVTDTIHNLGNMDWRNLFTDPYLQSLIQQGLEHNTDYRAAQLRVKEAEATLLSAKLAFLPSFAFSPQGGTSSFDGAKATWTYSVPVTASWELDIFGRMRNAKKQSQALYAQSEDYRQAVRTQLIASIANPYYTLLMLDEQLALSKQTAKSWEETVVSARALMNAGQYDEAGVSQMEATCYSVQASVLDLEEQINQAENSLALLLAETPRRYERGKLSEQAMPEDFSVGIPLQLLANRPDVRSAEHALEAAFYATNQARSNFYPSITLSGSAGWTNEAGSMIVALLNAGTEVNDALTAYQTSRNKANLYEKQVEALRRAERSTSLLMEHGTHTYLEVLTARQTLLGAELEQVANRFAELQSRVNLYQALGGGRER